MRTLIQSAALSLALVSLAARPATAEDAAQTKNEAHMNASAKVVQSSVDTCRKGDFEGWLRHFAPDATVIINDVVLIGRAELRKVFNMFRSDAKAVGLEIRHPEILESGWTGDRIYHWTKEYLGETEAVVYTEYEVRGGQIVTISARY